MPDTMTKVASVPHHDFFIPDTDDILIVVPEPGFKDTVECARVTVAALQDYSRQLGKKCGLVIVINNLLAQEPESRRVYADGLNPQLFWAITMVVNNPFARVIGNLALHLNSVQVPLVLVDSIESGVAWLKANRKT